MALLAYCWKFFLVRWRHKFLTLLEVVVPVLFFVLLGNLGQSLITVIESDQNSRPNPVNLSTTISQFGGMQKLFYAPMNDDMDRIMQGVRADLGLTDKRFRGFSSSYDMDQYLLSLRGSFAAVEISVLTPTQFEYTIKSGSASHPPSKTDSVYKSAYDRYEPDQSYMQYADSVIPLQTALDNRFLMQASGKSEIDDQVVVEEVYYEENRPATTIAYVMIALVIYFIYSVMAMTLIKLTTEERASGIIELMKIMGMQAWVPWAGNYMCTMLLHSITIITGTVFLRLYILVHTNAFLILIFMVFFFTALIFFLFFSTTLFDRPVFTILVGMVLYVAAYIVADYANKSNWMTFKILTMLLPVGPLIMGFAGVGRFEAAGTGLTFGTLFVSPEPDVFNFFVCLVFFIIDAVLFAILTWYMVNIRPGRYGIPKPLNFPCTKSFWTPFHSTVGTNSRLPRGEFFEPPPERAPKGIVVRNLSRRFGSFSAVDRVSMDIYQNRITVLLGKNGAGKTTTMSMITGMLRPTSGSVTIKGYDLHKELKEARNSMGYCPQHNLIIPELTIRQHLMLFAHLKGTVKPREAVSRLLDVLSLFERANNRVSSLSGGMKRRLCLGMALIGEPKVLILDEPTSGLDTELRRELWDLILSLRGSRTIFLTTHFMEEADVLGDYIAIMDHGSLQCFGTPMFLKKAYGSGYQITLVLDSPSKTDEITSEMRNIIPETYMKQIAGTTAVFIVPLNADSKYASMFQMLENKKSALGIQCMGGCVTTLGEVFMRVGGDVPMEASATQVDSSKRPVSHDVERSTFLVYRSFLDQLKALLLKRLYYEKRKKFINVLFVVLSIFASFFLFYSHPHQKAEYPALDFSLQSYPNTEISYSGLDNEIEMLEGLKQAAEQAHMSAIQREDVEKYLSSFADSKPEQYSHTFGVVYKPPLLKVLYSERLLHGAPVAVNLAHNLLLHKYGNSRYSGIKTKIQPFFNGSNMDPASPESSAWRYLHLISFSITTTLMMVVLTGLFVLFMVYESREGFKQIQLMTGVSPFLYWFSIFIWNFAVFLLCVAVITCLIPAFDSVGEFANVEAMGYFFLLLFFFGLAAVPYVSIFSMQNSTAKAIGLYVLVGQLFGPILWIILMTCATLSVNTAYTGLVKFCRYIFYLSPFFTLVEGALEYADKASFLHMWNHMTDYKRQEYCIFERIACCEPGPACEQSKSYLRWNSGLSTVIYAFIVDFIFYFLVIILIEKNVFKKLTVFLRKHLLPQKVKDQPVLDAEVRKEKDMIDSGSSSYAYQVHNLHKIYGCKFKAVEGLSFGVRPGECFGLLGVNGAGKSTTFKMLTGDAIPDAGDAAYNTYNMGRERRKYLMRIGYCPQGHGLNFALTGRETLKTIAKLRGVSKRNISTEINKLAKDLDLTEYLDRICGTYSGGNKRKLNTAMALIGNPPVVMLDEPTSGIDPVSRQKLWDILIAMRSSQEQVVILTSHSMEECETVCNRLGIMASGQLACIGPIQYLKDAFCQGYSVQIKLKKNATEDETDQLRITISETFKATLKDEHSGFLQYQLTDKNLKFSKVFLSMEKIKNEHSVIDQYVVGDTTLEEVFLSFARQSKKVKK